MFFRQLLLTLLNGHQQLFQGVTVLQRAQPRCVRRGNIDRDIGGVLIHFFQANQVVLGGILHRRIKVLTDIDTQHAVEFGFFHLLNQVVHPFVVEAHAVDDGATFRDTEQTRLRVAWLRARGNGTNFDKAKPQTSESVDIIAVLIQPCCQTNRIRKLDARHRHRSSGHLRCKVFQQAEALTGTQHIQTQFMGRFTA